MTTTLNDDAHNGDPEPLNPHHEYLERCAERARRNKRATPADIVRSIYG